MDKSLLAAANIDTAKILYDTISIKDARKYKALNYNKEAHFLCEKLKKTIWQNMLASALLISESKMVIENYLLHNEVFFSEHDIANAGKYELLIPTEDLMLILSEDVYGDLINIYNMTLTFMNCDNNLYKNVSSCFFNSLINNLSEVIAPNLIDNSGKRILLFAGLTRFGLVGVTS